MQITKEKITYQLVFFSLEKRTLYHLVSFQMIQNVERRRPLSNVCFSEGLKEEPYEGEEEWR